MSGADIDARRPVEHPGHLNLECLRMFEKAIFARLPKPAYTASWTLRPVWLFLFNEAIYPKLTALRSTMYRPLNPALTIKAFCFCAEHLLSQGEKTGT